VEEFLGRRGKTSPLPPARGSGGELKAPQLGSGNSLKSIAFWDLKIASKLCNGINCGLKVGYA